MLRATPDSPRMFESDVVDFFSRTHWAVVPGIFVPVSVGMLAYGVMNRGVSVVASLGLAVAGFVVWTLVEYWLHRTLFHWQPPGEWGERMHFLIHGVHHTWPKDKYRLVMPPAVSISLYFIFLGVFWALMGDRLVWEFPRRVCGWVHGVRPDPLLYPSLQPEERVRAAAEEAPHAPSLQGARSAVRSFLQSMGLRFSDPPMSNSADESPPKAVHMPTLPDELDIDPLLAGMLHLAMYLDLSDDRLNEPDAACRALEHLGPYLARFDDDELTELGTQLQRIAAHAKKARWPVERRQFIEDFLDNCGLGAEPDE